MEEKKNTKLADFGKKIGGARKDQWKGRGMSLGGSFGDDRSGGEKIRDQG